MRGSYLVFSLFRAIEYKVKRAYYFIFFPSGIILLFPSLCWDSKQEIRTRSVQGWSFRRNMIFPASAFRTRYKLLPLRNDLMYRPCAGDLGEAVVSEIISTVVNGSSRYLSMEMVYPIYNHSLMSEKESIHLLF